MSEADRVAWTRVEQDGRVLGFVAVHSTICGRARGGLRLVPDLDAVELRESARAMTLKYGLLRLPQGGAKAGLIGDPDVPLEERRARLLAFGRGILPLLRDRRYVPDADLGTGAADMRWLFHALGLPMSPREWRSVDSGAWTACSVVAAARAALAHRGGTLAGAAVAIEGFGAVGSAVASLANASGARVIAISTSRGALYDSAGLDVAALVAGAREHGSAVVERWPSGERLPPADLLELPADVLIPCARHHSIHAGNAAAVRAGLVCPGANAPFAGGVAAVLESRGTICVPDFVANCGGVLGGTMVFASIDGARTHALIDGEIASLVAGLLRRAERDAASLRDVAERLALQRFGEVQRAAEHPRPLRRFFDLGLASYRRGLVPGFVSAALGPRWIRRRIRLEG